MVKFDKNKRPSTGGKKNFRESSQSDNFLYVEGESVVCDYLKLNPDVISKVYCVLQPSKALQTLIDNCGKSLVVLKAREEFIDFRVTSPVWARIEIKVAEETEFFAGLDARKKDLVVVCDHITDPRNLGAIVRSAAFFGVKDIIIARDRQVQLTSVVINTAQGGFAKSRLVSVVNVVRALEKLKEAGYWVLGAEMNGQQLDKIKQRFEKTALVLGSEGKGLSELCRKRCDLMVSIPSIGESLDSLNVSVAAGIMLYEMSKGRTD